jgi:hypothetical protein
MANNMGRKPRSIENDDRNAQLERLLIEGDVVSDEHGNEKRVFLTGQAIATRLGISKAWVSKYAQTRKCYERRAAWKKAVQDKAREKLAMKEGNRIAFDLDHQLALCDGILVKYQQAIEERGVGNVTAADINAMIRLRHFIEGNADSRVETQQQNVTLEMMQEAHAKLVDDRPDEEESAESDRLADAG